MALLALKTEGGPGSWGRPGAGACPDASGGAHACIRGSTRPGGRPWAPAQPPENAKAPAELSLRLTDKTRLSARVVNRDPRWGQDTFAHVWRFPCAVKREGGREGAQSRAELKPESIKQTPLTLGPPQPLHCCRPLGPHSGPHGRSSPGK